MLIRVKEAHLIGQKRLIKIEYEPLIIIPTNIVAVDIDDREVVKLKKATSIKKRLLGSRSHRPVTR